MSEEVKEKKKRTRKCREIDAVTECEGQGCMPVVGWPPGITRRDRAIAEAKKIQTEWASRADAATLRDIILMRRLATVRGSSQTVMAFTVE
jgi:hypothetical protein